jgi:hypothetical protein
MKGQFENIHSRAMLASLHISTWSARKFDKQITAEVNRKHAASPDAGRYNKQLLGSDAISYRVLMRAAADARHGHYAQTLAWSDEGWRLLPTANYFEFIESMRKARTVFEMALEAFVHDYPAMRESARARLNGMYREEDFPAPSAIRSKFGFALDFAPLPAEGDFRVSLPADQIASIETSVQERIQTSAAESMRDAWNRLYETVAHIHERLSDPDAIFRDSLIENAREMCDVLRRLNFAGDPQLESMRTTVEQQLAKQDPQTLRDNPGARAAVAEQADAILSAMRGIYGGAQ